MQLWSIPYQLQKRKSARFPTKPPLPNAYRLDAVFLGKGKSPQGDSSRVTQDSGRDMTMRYMHTKAVAQKQTPGSGTSAQDLDISNHQVRLQKTDESLKYAFFSSDMAGFSRLRYGIRPELLRGHDDPRPINWAEQTTHANHTPNRLTKSLLLPSSPFLPTRPNDLTRHDCRSRGSWPVKVDLTR